MILPSKHLSENRALLTVGSLVLKLLSQPKTVSGLWEAFRVKTESETQMASRIAYDWFILSLDLLYSLGIIELEKGLIVRSRS